MSIRTFFERVGHDIKVVAGAVEKDFQIVFTDLFGAQALSELETTAKTLVESDFGKAILADAEQLIVEVNAGRVTVGNAIVTLASDIVTQGIAVGKCIGNTLSIMVASMVVAKAQGVLATPTAAAPPATTPVVLT